MPSCRVDALLRAIDHFKENRDPAPDQNNFLNKEQQAAVTREDGTFRVSLYKAFLFQAITAAIKSRDLNLAHSYRYRSLDAYLIDKDEVATGQVLSSGTGWINRICQCQGRFRNSEKCFV